MTNFLTQPNGRKQRLLFVGLALVVIVLHELLVVGQVWGLGFLLFMFAVNAAFFGLVYATKNIRLYWPLWLLLPILILSIDIVLYNNQLVTGPVPLLVYLLTILMWVLVTINNPDKKGFLFSSLPVGPYVSGFFTRLKGVLSDMFVREKDSPRDLVYKKIALGVIIAIPILFVFTFLLSSADAVFSQWIERLFSFNIDIDPFARVVRIIIFTLFLAAFFYLIIHQEHRLRHQEKNVWKLDTVISAVVLSLVNALFLIFVIAQFTHLFGGNEFVLDNGLTYADYARSGFNQLVVVMVLTAVLLVVFYRSASTDGKTWLLKILKLVLLVLVSIIAISALTRMNLYQDTYGFTVGRLYVEWFIYVYFALALFTALCIIQKKPFAKYWHGAMILSLLAFVVVSSLNVDKIIARENVDRYLAGEKRFDLHYLSSLSIDAWSEINRAADSTGTFYTGGTVRTEFFNPLEKTDDENIMNIYSYQTMRNDWREWNRGYERGVEGVIKK